MKFRLIFLLLLLFLSIGCANKEKSAISAATGYAVAVQNNDYATLYEYTCSDLQELRNKEDFIAFINATGIELDLQFEKVLFDQDGAYVLYKSNGDIVTVHMIYEDGWKIKYLEEYFTEECISESCDDDDVCTVDLCNNETNFICEHKKIDDCCYSDDDCDGVCVDNRCEAECFSDEECRGFCYENRCVECVTNNDCVDSKPFCYGYKCVGCVDDNDCQNMYDNKVICYEHECVMCIANKDCYNFYVKDSTGEELYKAPYCKDNECVECRRNSDCDDYCVFGKCSSYAASEYDFAAVVDKSTMIDYGGVPYKVSIIEYEGKKINLKMGSNNQWVSEGTDVIFNVDDKKILVYVDYVDKYYARLFFGKAKYSADYCGDGKCLGNERSMNAEDEYTLCEADCKVLYDTIDEFETETYTFLNHEYEIMLDDGLKNITINGEEYPLNYKDPVLVEDNIYVFKDKTERKDDVFHVTFVLFESDD